MNNYFKKSVLNHCIVFLVSSCLITQSPAWALAPESLLSDRIESRAQEAGEEILRRMDNIKPSFVNGFKDFLMDFSMSAAGWKAKVLLHVFRLNPIELKVKLLEFLDVAPVLKTSAQVFTQFLIIFQSNSIVRLWIYLSTPFFVILYPFYRQLVLLSVKFVATRFIASEDYDGLIKKVKMLKDEKADVTVDVLGEGIRTKRQVAETVEAYKTLLRRLKSAGVISPNISVKLTGLSSNFDELNIAGQREAVENLKEILREVIKAGGVVYIDMEEYKYKDLTLSIFKEISEDPEFKDTNNLGVVVQVYLKDTKRDVQELMRWSREHDRTSIIRLVKGAYWDQENIWATQEDREYIPVWADKWETDKNYEEIAQMVLEDIAWSVKKGKKPAIKPAFASHNARTVAKVISLIENLKIDKDFIVFEMLYGMGEKLRKALSAMGFRVRVYTPFGNLIPGMRYLVRRVLENTANEGFISQSKGKLTSEKIKKLLKNPVDILKEKKKRTKKTKEPNRIKKSSSDFTNEPLTEWHILDNQKRMKEALLKVSSGFAGPEVIPIVIGGEKIYFDKKDCFPSKNIGNPSKGENIALVSKSTKEHADLAMEAADTAFNEWKDSPVSLRAEYLFNAARIMREKRFELSALMVYEVGKTWKEADADTAEAIDFLEYYALCMKDISITERLKPVGPGVVIAPWNFPLAILTGMTAAAITSGNTVVMKPAEQSSAVGYELMKILQEAMPIGVPKGVVNFVPGYGEYKNDDNLSVGKHLTENEKTKFIAFTGSTDAGNSIRKAAAKSKVPKKVILETGGKNAIYVDRTADLDRAVQGVIDSFTGFSGQKCSACSRVFIHEAVYDEFLKRLREKIETTIVGDTDDPSTQMGSVIDDDAARKIMNMINQAHADRWGKGGKERWKLEYGEGEIKELKRRLRPTIFSSTSPEAYAREFAQIEMFGPGLAVIPAKNIDHAVKMINSVNYGLTSGIYTRSELQKINFIKKVQAGVIYINRKITAALVSMVGFGGVKQSGTGTQAGSPDYLFQFLDPLDISEGLPSKEPLSEDSFKFEENDDLSIFKSSQESFEKWKNVSINRRLQFINSLREKGINIPDDFVTAIKEIYTPNSRPLRKVVGIKNQFIYEPLGVGILIPGSNHATNWRMVLTAIFTGNTLIAPDTREMRIIRNRLKSAGIRPNVLQLRNHIPERWISQEEIRFVMMTQEDNDFSIRDRARKEAALSVYPTRVIVEEGNPSNCWNKYTPYYISRFLNTKSTLEILPPEIANTEFLSAREQEFLDQIGTEPETETTAELRIKFDADSAVKLLIEIRRRGFVENRKYEIKYDMDRLSDTQQNVIREYVELLKKDSIDITANSFGGTERDYLIQIECKDKTTEEPLGKGEVNVGGHEKLYDRPIRIVGIINMALAASNLPKEAEAAKDDPLAQFIREQYRQIMDREIDERIDLKKIPLEPPNAIDVNEVDKLNRLAIELLTAA